MRFSDTTITDQLNNSLHSSFTFSFESRKSEDKENLGPPNGSRAALGAMALHVTRISTWTGAILDYTPLEEGYQSPPAPKAAGWKKATG